MLLIFFTLSFELTIQNCSLSFRYLLFFVYLGNVNAVTFHTQHHVLLPSGTQTLNRHVYRFTPNPNIATIGTTDVDAAAAGAAATSVGSVGITALRQSDETAKYLYG